MEFLSIKKMIGLLIIIPLVYGSLRAVDPDSSQDLADRIAVRSGLTLSLDDRGWEWQEDGWRGTPEKGWLSFSDSKWLMYLIHWGPIQKETMTIDYVRQRMLAMWGVNFEFSGIEGTTTMAGHEAVFVEAYGTGRRFYTRFIVWNCPVSGREFIADTNYNLVTRTPKSDFEAELRSARTICCHEGATTDRFPDMTESFASRKFGFSFFHPERWFISDSPYYVPFPGYEGIRSSQMGSLLGLCSDENLRVILLWQPLVEPEKKKDFLGADMDTIQGLNELMKERNDLGNFEVSGSEKFTLNEKRIDRIWGKYRFNVENDNDAEAMYPGRGIFQTAQWSLPRAKKKVTVILLTKTYLDHGVSSNPQRDIHDRFMLELIRVIR